MESDIEIKQGWVRNGKKEKLSKSSLLSQRQTSPSITHHFIIYLLINSESKAKLTREKSKKKHKHKKSESTTEGRNKQDEIYINMSWIVQSFQVCCNYSTQKQSALMALHEHN